MPKQAKNVNKMTKLAENINKIIRKIYKKSKKAIQPAKTNQQNISVFKRVQRVGGRLAQWIEIFHTGAVVS